MSNCFIMKYSYPKKAPQPPWEWSFQPSLLSGRLGYTSFCLLDASLELLAFLHFTEALSISLESKNISKITSLVKIAIFFRTVLMASVPTTLFMIFLLLVNYKGSFLWTGRFRAFLPKVHLAQLHRRVKPRTIPSNKTPSPCPILDPISRMYSSHLKQLHTIQLVQVFCLYETECNYSPNQYDRL